MVIKRNDIVKNSYSKKVEFKILPREINNKTIICRSPSFFFNKIHIAK